MKQKLEEQKEVHQRLSQLLEAEANPATAEWFTNYLKGAIRYRGVKTPALKGILSEFFLATGLDKESDAVQLNHIRYWLSIPMAEDKFTAILWLQKWFRHRQAGAQRSNALGRIFDLLENVFACGDIHDWSTNDWLCVRVLETIPKKHPDFIDRLVGWREASSVWQRRSGLLAFKKSIKAGAFHEEVEGIVAKLLPTEERFVQTAIGWVLSDASRTHPHWAARMFERHFGDLSHEVIVRHTKHLPNHTDLKKRSQFRKRRNEKIEPFS